MEIQFFKTLHIFGFVAWFAGLFYLVRMFVYHTEAHDQEEPKKRILTAQYALMEQRVMKIICNPAIVITWFGGLMMIYLYGMDWFRLSPWLHVKLALLVLLTCYHWYCGKIIHQLELGKTSFSSTGFRLFNEVPTIFLILITALAIYKNGINYLYLIVSIILIGIVLILLTKLYKYFRERSRKNI